MEEKERYVIRYDLDYNRCLIDTEKNQGVGDYIQIVKLLNQQSKRIKELEQQLAEKDKELSEYVKIVDDLHKQLSDKCDFCDKTKDQDKISFAIQQLEKAKEKILSYEEIYYQFLENGAKIPVFCVENFRVRQNIDHQINELKGVE